MDTIKYPRGYIKPPYVKISLRSKRDMREKAFGKALTDALWLQEPRYLPKIFDTGQKRILFQDQAQFLEHWYVLDERTYDGKAYEFPRELHWKNKNRLRSYGHFNHTFMTTTNRLASASLSVTFTLSAKVAWKDMFLQLCDLMQPQLGMLHIFTPENCPPNKRESSFQRGNFNAIWNPKIPGLGWMFAAGDEFYDRVMAPKVNDIGVERIDYGSYCTLEIAKGSDEILHDLASFQTRRDSLLERLPIIDKINRYTGNYD